MLPTPYGDSVYTRGHIKPQTMHSAGGDGFWCGQSLERGETIKFHLYLIRHLSRDVAHVRFYIDPVYYEQRHLMH